MQFGVGAVPHVIDERHVLPLVLRVALVAVEEDLEHGGGRRGRSRNGHRRRRLLREREGTRQETQGNRQDAGPCHKLNLGFTVTFPKAPKLNANPTLNE